MLRTTSETLSLLSLLALTAVGCAKDPTAGKAAATVAEPQAVKAVPQSAESLAVSPAASKIGFVGAKVTAQHIGEFKDFSGTISMVSGKVEGGQVEFEVKPDSVVVDGGLPRLEGHLKSADFFEVEKYPTARFVSTEIKDGSDAVGMTHTVTGNLTMRGTTRSVTFPARIEVADDAVEAKAEFGINRKDFGIEYPGKPDDLIKENVLIQVDLKAPRKS